MILEIRDISFAYNSERVLNNISFKVAPGKILGIVGPNGAGKTTLLRCINNVLKPAQGVVYLDGTKLAQLRRKEIARLIGFVPQRESVAFPFTVYEIIFMGRYPHLQGFGMAQEEDYRVVDDTIRLLNIEHLKHRRIDELSGGEFQKVVLARALVQEPKVLLLDEPTLHLDIRHQLELLEQITEIIAHKQIITVMVTHDLFLVGRYCEDVLVMKGGRIYSFGRTRDILTPDVIRNVYNIEVDIFTDTSSDKLIIIPKYRIKEA